MALLSGVARCNVQNTPRCTACAVTGEPVVTDEQITQAWSHRDDALVAVFRAGSFSAAARLIAVFAEAADAADHHPDIDLRYPDRVLVRLTSHDRGSTVTARDHRLAATLSLLAAQHGATVEVTAAT